MAGELQTMLTWAEDRALLRSTPSAEPGAKTGARAEHTSALRSLVDRSTTAPGLAPMRQTFAARCREIRATMPFPIHLRQSDEIPFHGEPRQSKEVYRRLHAQMLGRPVVLGHWQDSICKSGRVLQSFVKASSFSSSARLAQRLFLSFTVPPCWSQVWYRQLPDFWRLMPPASNL
jgi:hypothetical protein